DGFRFDLAELLEAPLLSEIELALRAIKPSVILIAEPWSFRGRIDSQLSRTSFSCWNDGFRDFIRDYVKGNGDSRGVIHYLKGSPGKSFARPSQSINYVESHDDHCLIDAITENPHRDGRKPTADDQRRSRMGFALTMMSQGVPMLAAGQDFHRSKSGHGNTYLRGDLNTLDYERLAEFRESHEYCRRWIEFRRSEIGSVLRLTEYQPDSFWQEFRPETGSAAALLLCSNPTNERHRLLFAINPDAKERKLPVTPEEIGRARLLTTIDSFSSDGIPDPFERSVQGEIILPPLEIGLWIVE
ncbi:MAG: glycoside hydrolase family 1, partial [Opitutales bacterium]